MQINHQGPLPLQRVCHRLCRDAGDYSQFLIKFGFIQNNKFWWKILIWWKRLFAGESELDKWEWRLFLSLRGAVQGDFTHFISFAVQGDFTNQPSSNHCHNYNPNNQHCHKHNHCHNCKEEVWAISLLAQSFHQPLIKTKFQVEIFNRQYSPWFMVIKQISSTIRGCSHIMSAAGGGKPEDDDCWRGGVGSENNKLIEFGNTKYVGREDNLGKFYHLC